MHSSQSISVDQEPHLYISGLNISVASATVIAVAPGQCRDSRNNIDMTYWYPIVPSYLHFQERHYDGLIHIPQTQYTNAVGWSNPLFINSAVVGVNGLDQGVLAASTNYVVYLIADSTGKHPNAGLLSLQSNAFPFIPLGYDSYRLLGYVTTSSGTAFTAASVLNASAAKGYYLQPPVSVLSGGHAITFTAVPLTAAIPTTTEPFVRALLVVTFIPSAAGDTVQIRPTGSAATTNLVTITGNVAGVAQTNYIIVNVGVSAGQPSIDYEASVVGDSVSISVAGYYVTLA